METRSAKKRKLLLSQFKSSETDEEDRITDLPDAVIHQILHLLPIKTIAQTSLLSKRWRTIWYSLPDLDFTTLKPLVKPHNTKKTFYSWCNSKKGMDYINQVLSLRGKDSCIRILRLDAILTLSQLIALMRNAVKHNVQELDVKVETNVMFNFPRCVLSCRTLRVFRLKTRIRGFRLPPSSIMREGLQSLNTLSLSSFSLHHDGGGCLVDLFTDSSFPHLRKLELVQCHKLKRLGVSCRALVEFTLVGCSYLVRLDVCCPKLEAMVVSDCSDPLNSNFCVKIDAPKLRNITWNGNSIADYSGIDSLTSLHEAFIDFDDVAKSMVIEKFQEMSDFLLRLSHCRCLILGKHFVEVLSTNNRFACTILQPFINLKSLELQTDIIPGLTSLLSGSLSLHTLIIQLLSNHYKPQKSSNHHKRDVMDLCKHEKEHYSGSLKVVKVHGISECKDEISLIKFLLRYARVLEEMVIICSEETKSARGSLQLERIKSLVMGFSWASSDVEIVVR